MNPDQNKNNSEEKKDTPSSERVPIKSLRTFQGDVQEAISKNKYSSTTILVSEQKRQIERPEVANLVKKSEVKNKTYILLGSIFIILGVASIVLLFNNIPENGVTPQEKQTTLITYSEERPITTSNLTRNDLVNNIIEQKQTWNGVVNSVLYINLNSNTNVEDISKVSSLIGPNMPPSLSRSFAKDYMLGIYSFDTNETFMIITIDDYSLAYPGMLKWEENMAKDLDGFFDINPSTLENSVFVDETVKNRDLRVLKDSTGKPLVIYSFIDRKTLIIARNEGILSAIVDKIILNKQVR
jgi:hypothetical protein